MGSFVLGGRFFDETEYLCKIIAYDEEEETLYLVSEEAELTSYSLDGIYKSSIENLEDPVICKENTGIGWKSDEIQNTKRIL